MIQRVKIRRLHLKLGGQSRRYNSQNNHTISPLLKFDSAVLRYPQEISRNTSDMELGLEADTITYLQNQDMFLASKGALESSNNEQLQHLQNHWQQSASNHEHQALHVDLHVYPNTECKSAGGGHILLGRNASGKSLTLKTLIHTLHAAEESEQSNPYLHSGSLYIDKQSETKQMNTRYNHFLSHVSFESHSQLLSNPISVHRALIPGGGNRLSPTAQFLIVRLGMFPLLQRTVDTLSTGEIRRVLLVRALVTKPSLLLLDNVMDGLDVLGRQGVQNTLERVLSGFRMDILVQGISAKDTARTQVLLSTLRHEEISDGFDRVTFVGAGRILTEDRGQRSGVDLIHCLYQWSEDESSYNKFTKSLDKADGLNSEPNVINAYSKHDIPSKGDLVSFWESSNKKQHRDILVEECELKVIRDNTILLSGLNWTVQRGERWHLAGTNGGELCRLYTNTTYTFRN
jgi:molybdate transport system ATP-binding protein